MRIVVGILCAGLGLVYLGQLLSAVSFRRAQRLGLQEGAETAAPIFSRLEWWAALWDALWLWTLPIAGLLMLIDHAWWPFAALVGGGTYIDAGGREMAKGLGLLRHGVETGSRRERRLFFGMLALFIVCGALAIVTALGRLV